ncbi:hypothetical protein CORC01_11517 [Colletotrichum orchidophilum]|uniref:Uncharacterized protein n=1 Tax=Colletotrichum orchidophilum TaxID=1209926 RepID=A0A1G4AVJ7_9PEZI|nr:uncharacterized protein CORC01_11517 [Colletotrichum orchidophilum]OHE93200.1 hypothetical protein CORC01_11517 [Colletotrichum orchidophilum]
MRCSFHYSIPSTVVPLFDKDQPGGVGKPSTSNRPLPGMTDKKAPRTSGGPQ